MNVFIVYGETNYEGDTTLGVFATHAKAEAFVAGYKAKVEQFLAEDAALDRDDEDAVNAFYVSWDDGWYGYDRYQIEEVEVQ